ncbi:hypothetical protein BDV95DRAFT_575880 [Massariosphaeria phaeospora]|uniref:Rhodopsin domain-containing protein n=1 Tax=Massariosphaeria phaeospora TaxID=100035 RepID=A0A7C8MC88_9PLEO|nr:hypothetical protein BDV95DRAFT_575880 [Massariosphaeria phaeospora]
MVQSFVPTTTGQLTVIVIPGIFLPLTILTVGMRFRSRILTKQKLWIDDWLVLLALILVIALYVVMIVCVVWGGLGLPVFQLKPKNIEIFAKAGAVASGIFWGAAATCTQVSILVFYVRVFGIERWHRYTCYGLMALCIGWFISLVGAVGASCMPLKKLWMPKLAGTCIDNRKMCSGTGLSHVVLDFLILLMALPPIWNLKTTLVRKIRATSLLTIGLIATIFSLLRVSCLFGLVKIRYGDITGSVWLSFTFELLEVVLGIICVCIPTLIPALKQVQNSRLGSYARRILTTNASSNDTKGSIERSGGSADPKPQWYKLTDHNKSQTALKHGNSIERERSNPSFEEAGIHVRSELQVVSNRI